jgi:hypothetical protein
MKVYRDGDIVILDSYNPPVSIRLSVADAATLRDRLEAAVIDYDAAQATADTGAMVPCVDCGGRGANCVRVKGLTCGDTPCTFPRHQ